jgi:hypothetical protein
VDRVAAGHRAEDGGGQQVNARLGRLYAHLTGTMNKCSRADAATLVVTYRVESARFATAEIPGTGGRRTSVRPVPFELELKLPYGATRPGLAKLLEDAARTLRNGEL